MWVVAALRCLLRLASMVITLRWAAGSRVALSMWLRCAAKEARGRSSRRGACAASERLLSAHEVQEAAG